MKNKYYKYTNVFKNETSLNRRELKVTFRLGDFTRRREKKVVTLWFCCFIESNLRNIIYGDYVLKCLHVCSIKGSIWSSQHRGLQKPTEDTESVLKEERLDQE